MDQVVFSIESGAISHEEICGSLELFAKEVMPEFKQREEQRSDLKNSEDQLISEEVMMRKEQPKTFQEIPTIIMRDKIGRARVGKECRSRWSPYH